MLVILRSIPVMGKSTLSNEFDPSTVVSLDEIRREIFGTCDILPVKSSKVWSEVKRRIELRMKHGRFTIMDATNLSTKSIRNLKQCADEAGQETRILNIEPDMNLALSRLARRRVGVDKGACMSDERLMELCDRYHNATPAVIENFGNIFYSGTYPEIKNILHSLVEDRNVFQANTDNVFVFGDVHGFKRLAEIAFAHIPAESHIFSAGDLIDRGDDSMGTLELFMNDPRVAGFSMGNHEFAFLREYEAGGRNSSSNSIARQATHKEFHSLSSGRQADIIDFLKSGKTHIVVDRIGEKVLISHAGIGDYDPEFITYDQAITDKVNPVSSAPRHGIPQIHGHMSWEYNGDLSGNVKNIDSGCGHGNSLTVYAPFNPKLSFRVTPKGEIEYGNLF